MRAIAGRHDTRRDGGAVSQRRPRARLVLSAAAAHAVVAAAAVPRALAARLGRGRTPGHAGHAAQ